MSVDDNIVSQIERKLVREEKKHPILIVLGIIIPILILGYLFYSNYVASHTFNYLYEIGTENEKYLSPANRISVPNLEEGSRNMTSQLVYFSVPIARGSKTVAVQVRYFNVFPEKASFSLGAKNDINWSYDWKPFAIANKGQWEVETLYYNLNETNPEKGQLSFVFNAPHLNPNVAYSNLDKQVPIDWINITVYKPGWKE